jgi:cell division protein FtsI (penicillin-binding protein 3)
MKNFFIFLLLIAVNSQAQFRAIRLQAFSEKTLFAALQEQKAESGLAMIMDLSTNKIVSSAGYSKKEGGYIVDTNLMNVPIEPNGLMNPIAAAILMDNFGLQLTDTVDLEGGVTVIDGKKIRDAEMHGNKIATLQSVIAESSNVGIAKFTNRSFNTQTPSSLFIDQLKGYIGTEKISNISNDKSSLLFWSIGYGLKLTPKQIFEFYYRVAKMDSTLFKHPSTLTKMHTALFEVCQNGTARIQFGAGSGIDYEVYGKTGSGLVANKNGYKDNQFLASFVGFTDRENPNYICLVMIKCKSNAPNHFGATVAAPIFKNLMTNLITNK